MQSPGEPGQNQSETDQNQSEILENEHESVPLESSTQNTTVPIEGIVNIRHSIDCGHVLPQIVVTVVSDELSLLSKDTVVHNIPGSDSGFSSFKKKDELLEEPVSVNKIKEASVSSFTPQSKASVTILEGGAGVIYHPCDQGIQNITSYK